MAESDNDKLQGRRVLLVEDEARIAMMVEDILEDMGLEVAGTASRLGDAMGKAKSLPFDVALLDVNLNGEPSFPVAEAVVARGRAIVFATGYDPGDLPEDLRGWPMLKKPFMRRELKRALQTALS